MGQRVHRPRRPSLTVQISGLFPTGPCRDASPPHTASGEPSATPAAQVADQDPTRTNRRVAGRRPVTECEREQHLAPKNRPRSGVGQGNRPGKNARYRYQRKLEGVSGGARRSGGGGRRFLAWMSPRTLENLVGRLRNLACRGWPRTVLDQRGGVTVWIIVGAVVALLVIATIVGGHQEAAYRIRTGRVRKPRRHPGEGYQPPPPPAA